MSASDHLARFETFTWTRSGQKGIALMCSGPGCGDALRVLRDEEVVKVDRPHYCIECARKYGQPHEA